MKLFPVNCNVADLSGMQNKSDVVVTSENLTTFFVVFP